MNIIESVKTCFRKYATFTGRASRSEYWWWTLAIWIFFVLILVLFMPSASTLSSMESGAMLDIDAQRQYMKFMSITGIVYLVILLPTIAVAVRRLHDINKSGWFLLISFIPIIGPLICLYWFICKGTQGDNQYGPDPLAGQ